MLTRYLLILAHYITCCCCQTQVSYSTFKFVDKFGLLDESKIKNYVTLANDPKSNLPDDFTICTSLLIKYIQGPTQIFQMYKKDGSHWFNLHINTNVRDYGRMSEAIRMVYIDPETGGHNMEFLSGSTIPINPHSWYHVCVGLDTVSGLLRIVINGNLIFDTEKKYFRNTNNWKPSSLIGKLLGMELKFTINRYQISNE